MIRFVVHGSPKAQPRAKARNFGAHAAVYNPKTADQWKALVILAARAADGFAACPLSGPLVVSIAWYLPRPKRLMRVKDPDGPVPCEAKPDRDNLDKAVLDALKDAGVFHDDNQVFAGVLAKFYHGKRGSPCARISVCPLCEVTGWPTEAWYWLTEEAKGASESLQKQLKIVLCFRCEHRARYLQDRRGGISSPYRPRFQCGAERSIEGVYSCYMYEPTAAVQLVADEGDERPLGGLPVLRARAHGIDLKSRT